jgi:hypothetical protein
LCFLNVGYNNFTVRVSEFCVSAMAEVVKCIHCGKTVGQRQRAVSCDACERWQHLGCDSGKWTYNIIICYDLHFSGQAYNVFP